MVFKDIEPGANAPGYVLIKNIEQMSDKNGSPYLVLTIFDGKIDVKAKIWGCEKSFLDEKKVKMGEVANIVLNVSEYNGRPNYTITKIRHPKEEEYNKSDFLDLPPETPDVIYEKCLQLISTVKNKGLCSLLMKVFTEKEELLKHQGAAQMCHHNTIAGLIWHIYRTTIIADKIAETYPVIDRDMVITGAMLHDIGKTQEMITDSLGNTTYTQKGCLFTHSLLGYEIIKEYNQKLEEISSSQSGENNSDDIQEITPLTEKELDDLLHIIISHHGSLEFGAIKEPATLEAYVVHMADDLDSKVYIHEKYRTKILESGEISDKKDFFLGTRVYNP